MAKPEFYDLLSVAINEEDDDFEFANRQVVAEHFLRLQQMAAQVVARATALTAEIATLEVHKKRFARELKQIRRQVLAANYAKITKTATPEIQDAFVFLCLQDDPDLLTKFGGLEAELEEVTREIESREPRLTEFKDDLKAIERTAEYCKQYLDYEKLDMRINANRV